MLVATSPPGGHNNAGIELPEVTEEDREAYRKEQADKVKAERKKATAKIAQQGAGKRTKSKGGDGEVHSVYIVGRQLAVRGLSTVIARCRARPRNRERWREARYIFRAQAQVQEEASAGSVRTPRALLRCRLPRDPSATSHFAHRLAYHVSLL